MGHKRCYIFSHVEIVLLRNLCLLCLDDDATQKKG